MNDRIIKLGLDSHMLNYIDNETPRRYFLSGHADEDDLQKFAELIVRECMTIAQEYDGDKLSGAGTVIANRIDVHFEVNDDRKLFQRTD